MAPTKEQIVAGYERAAKELRGWLSAGSGSDLGRRSSGTRWTNEELLFLMVFGYMVVWALLPLVRVVSALPAPVGRAFTKVLNAGTRPSMS